MDNLILSILNGFIAGELTQAQVKAEFDKMRASIQDLKNSDGLSSEGDKLFKLFRLASEDGSLRLDKAFISKVI